MHCNLINCLNIFYACSCDGYHQIYTWASKHFKKHLHKLWLLFHLQSLSQTSKAACCASPSYSSSQRAMWFGWCGSLACNGSWPSWTPGRRWSGAIKWSWSGASLAHSPTCVTQVSNILLSGDPGLGFRDHEKVGTSLHLHRSLPTVMIH